MTTAAPIDAWSLYWAAGQTESCFQGSDSAVLFEALWAGFVDQLASGARVLDLACGAGAAARLCVRAARARGMTLDLTAVDAAQINPERMAPDPLNGAVRYVAGVRLERLPFADGAFDAAISQFGFEYAEEAPAALELARVLAPRGQARLILHAREGAAVKDVQTRLDRLTAVLDADGLVTLVRRMALGAAAGADVSALHARLPQALARAQALAQGAPPDDSAIFYARAFYDDWMRRDRYRPEDLARAIDEGWRHAQATAVRQVEMIKAARSREDVERLRARLAQCGLSAEPAAPVHNRGDQIAWRLDALKPG